MPTHNRFSLRNKKKYLPDTTHPLTYSYVYGLEKTTALNPSMPSGLSYFNCLGMSISNRGGVWLVCSFAIFDIKSLYLEQTK